MNKKKKIQILINILENLTYKKIHDDFFIGTSGFSTLRKTQDSLLKSTGALETLRKTQNDLLNGTNALGTLRKTQNDLLNGTNALGTFRKAQNDLLKSTGALETLRKTQNDLLNGTGALEALRKTQNDLLKSTGALGTLRKTQNDLLNGTGAFEYLKHLQNITKKINNNIFSINNDNLSNKSQKIEVTSKLINKLSIEESKKLLSNKLNNVNRRIIKILSKSCWVLPKELINNDYFYELIMSSDDNDIDNFIINYFKRNDYNMLHVYFKEIGSNILKMNSQLSREYHDFASTIMNTFYKKPSCSQVLIPSLFVLLEFINSTGSKYKPFDSNTSGKTFYKEGAKKSKNQLKYSMYLVGVNIYLNFNEYIKNGEQNINRNVVQHGKANPSKLTDIDFIKLSILCNAFSFEMI